MVPKFATLRIIEEAGYAARAFWRGGLQKKLHDLEKYKKTGVASGVSYGLSKIPFVGTEVSKGFELLTETHFDSVYRQLLESSTTAKERINNCLFVLERYLSASMRQAYNTALFYIKEVDWKGELECKDCQDAFKAAMAACVAQSCIDDLKRDVEIIKRLAQDLENEIREAALEVSARGGSHLEERIDNFRGNHPSKPCRPPGVEKCYWSAGGDIDLGKTARTYAKKIR
jgi:hypothetical protein